MGAPTLALGWRWPRIGRGHESPRAATMPASGDYEGGGAMSPESGDRPQARVLRSLSRGWRRRCPRCGEGPVFRGYVKVRERCGACGLELHHHRADDAPPYFTSPIVAHLVVPAMVLLERSAAPPQWLHFLLWLALVPTLSLILLPRVTGAIIGLQWARRRHGFGAAD